MEMSDRDLEWLRAVESSPLADTLTEMGAAAGWFLVEELRSGGFDPHRDQLLVWVADTAGALTNPTEPAPPASDAVEVSNAELGSPHTLVGDAGGRCAVHSDARPSAFGEGLVSVETEHGTLLLDPDTTSLVEAP